MLLSALSSRGGGVHKRSLPPLGVGLPHSLWGVAWGLQLREGLVPIVSSSRSQAPRFCAHPSQTQVAGPSTSSASCASPSSLSDGGSPALNGGIHLTTPAGEPVFGLHPLAGKALPAPFTEGIY